MNTDLELLIAELQVEFLDELPRRCNDLEDAVMSLESQQPGAFDELFRQVHSLKGTGGGVGVQMITTICHQFESFISEAKVSFDRKAASTALAYIDLLRIPIEKAGREQAGISAIEHSLDQMREASLSGRATILVVEPSSTVRALYQREFSNTMTRVHALKTGIGALERLLQEPFDLLIISRELADLNAVAVVAAVRESRSRNSSIPVIMVSSNTAPVPAYLSVNALVRRDVQLVPKLVNYINEVISRARSGAAKNK
jgi:chemotaxis protein histidine kinase CheA